MQKASPHKTFIPAPPQNTCACNDCPYMKLNTLEKLVYLCMKYLEVIMDESPRAAAKKKANRKNVGDKCKVGLYKCKMIW
jgi:quinolinate synthase